MNKFIIVTCVAAGAWLLQAKEADTRLTNATEVVTEMMGMPDKGVPQDLLEKAQCIVVVPGLKKAALGIGGQYGRGYATCRKAAAWSFRRAGSERMEGGSFRISIGWTIDRRHHAGHGSERHGYSLPPTSSRLARMPRRLPDRSAAMLGPTLTLALHAQILSYSRSRGAFAGSPYRAQVAARQG